MQGNPDYPITLPPEALWGDINGTPVELIEACDEHPDAGIEIHSTETPHDEVRCQSCERTTDAI